MLQIWITLLMINNHWLASLGRAKQWKYKEKDVGPSESGKFPSSLQRLLESVFELPSNSYLVCAPTAKAVLRAPSWDLHQGQWLCVVLAPALGPQAKAECSRACALIAGEASGRKEGSTGLGSEACFSLAMALYVWLLLLHFLWDSKVLEGQKFLS